MRYWRSKPRVIGKSKGRSSFLGRKYNQRKLNYRGTTYVFDRNIRTGNCSSCYRSVQKKQIRNTSLHHSRYDNSNVLAHTREVCTSCHMKLDPNCRSHVTRYYDRKQ